QAVAGPGSRRWRRAYNWSRAGRSRAAHGEAHVARADLAGKVGQHAVDRHGAEIVARAVAETHGAVLGLAGAAHEHVGHLAHLRVADAIAELLVAVVELGANARAAQPAVHAAGVLDVLFADRQD